MFQVDFVIKIKTRHPGNEDTKVNLFLLFLLSLLPLLLYLFFTCLLRTSTSLYIHTYIHTNVCIDQHTYLASYIHACILIYIHIHLFSQEWCTIWYTRWSGLWYITGLYIFRICDSISFCSVFCYSS